MSAPSFSVVLDPVGAHVHVRVFSGVEGSRALVGTLVVSPDEAAAFALKMTGPTQGPCAHCERELALMGSSFCSLTCESLWRL